MVTRPCPICGASDRFKVFADAAYDPGAWDKFAFSSRKTPEYMHYRLLECRHCDLLYASPVPARESLESAYREAAFESGEEARYASETYAHLLPEVIARIGELNGALDIGTGDGAFLEQLLLRGFRAVVGVEPSAAPVQAASPAVRGLIRQGPFRAADFAENSLALVTCFQTMEHVYEPLSLCRDAYRLLRPGGALLIVCHDRRALSARVLGLRSPIYDIEHLQLFSSQSLRYAFERAGFRGVETKPIVNRYPVHYWLRLFPLPSRAKSGLLSRLRASSLGRVPVPLPAGNFAAVGYKPS